MHEAKPDERGQPTARDNPFEHCPFGGLIIDVEGKGVVFLRKLDDLVSRNLVRPKLEYVSRPIVFGVPNHLVGHRRLPVNAPSSRALTPRSAAGRRATRASGPLERDVGQPLTVALTRQGPPGSTSFDNLIGSEQQRLRDRQPKGARGLDVTDQPEGSRLLDRKTS